MKKDIEVDVRNHCPLSSLAQPGPCPTKIFDLVVFNWWGSMPPPIIFPSAFLLDQTRVIKKKIYIKPSRNWQQKLLKN